MRILMLSWEYPPNVVGGIGTHVNALVPALARRGVDIILVTPSWGRGESVTRISEHVIVHRVDAQSEPRDDIYQTAEKINSVLEKSATELIGQGGFDLVHAHDWLVGFAARNLSGLHKIPLIATIHATERGRWSGQISNEQSRAINAAECLLVNAATRVITVSQSMRDEVSEYLDAEPNKVDVISNGVESAPFDMLSDDLRAFRTHYANPGDCIVFFVGRMTFEKGAQILLEAGPRVLEEMPQIKFVLAGKGEMLDTLRQRAIELGIAANVVFAGFVSDEERNRLFKVSDVAVFPSRYEPFGIVALEAMAAKCPVVVTNVGGLSEVVRHDNTGLVVPPDNFEALAWGILRTLRYPDLTMTRVTNAYRVVREEYNWDLVAERTVQVYEHVIKNGTE